MKTFKMKFVWFFLIAAAGLALLVDGLFFESGNTEVTGFGAGLLAVAVLKIVQYILIVNNDDRMKKYQVIQKEERLIMISEKSGRYTLLISILLELILGVILILTNNSNMAQIICIIAAIQSIIYLVLYRILSNRL